MLRKKSIVSMMAALFLTAGFMAGCSDDDDNGNGNVVGGVDGGNGNGNGRTVAEVLESNGDLSIFADAVERAGLMDMLQSDAHNYTVFAPTNEAFNEKYPEEQRESLFNDSARLDSLVRYHIVRYNSIKESSLLGASPIEPMLSGTEIRVIDETPEPVEGEEDSDMDLRLNFGTYQARIVEPDIEARNGVVHKIDKVLTERTVGQ